MPVRVKDIIDIVEGWAPRSHAITEDNPGLLVGDPSAPVGRVLVAVDATPAVIDEAVEGGAGMLITHHPLIFTPIRSIHTGEGQGRLLATLIGAGISLYAAHTNLDVADGGVEDLLASSAGLEAGRSDIQVLERSGEDTLLKLVVFVPEGYEDKVRDAISAAGAGWIGKYSDCAFMTRGTGTFRPKDGARPFIGEVGRVERTEEFRLETVLPESRRSAVLRALLEAHPYEEVAFDLYPLRNEGRSRGFGRIGRLNEPVRLGDLAGRLRRSLGAPYVRVCGDPAALVRTVATAAGSGGGNVAAAAAAGADVLVTGDVKHSQALLAVASGMPVIDVGHFSSERAVVAATVERLNSALRERGECVATASVSEREPFGLVVTGSGGDAAHPESAGRSYAAHPESGGGVYTAHVDGGSRGNPGPAACAVVLVDPEGNTLLEEGRYLGDATNNVAEYNALIMAAEAARDRGARRLVVNTDSELVARQLSGEYRVKNAGLAVLFERARRLLKGFDSWEVRYIPREQNVRADAIVNRTLDAAAGPDAVCREP